MPYLERSDNGLPPEKAGNRKDRSRCIRDDVDDAGTRRACHRYDTDRKGLQITALNPRDRDLPPEKACN